jgi:competence protein ComEC
MTITNFQKSFLTPLAFIIGIMAAEFVIIPTFYLYLFLTIFLTIILLIKNRPFYLIICLALILGIWRFDLTRPTFTTDQIKNASFSALVIKSETVTDKQRLTLKQNLWPGLIRVDTNLYPVYHYGDEVQVRGNLTATADPRYNKDNIYWLGWQPRISLIKTGQGNPIYSGIYFIKDKIKLVIQDTISEPGGSLLIGILLGDRQDLSPAMKNNFTLSGVSHILAVSGYNISLISITLLSLSHWLAFPRRRAFYLIITLIAFFVILTGASASVVRAGLMGTISLLAKHLGRKSSIYHILLYTAAAMAIQNPLVLLHDIGFQLSFLSTFGLLYLSTKIESHLTWISEKFDLRSNLSTTFSAMITTTPLILIYFGRLSIVAPLTNLLVLPLIPLIMLFGLFQVIGGLLFLPLGKLLAIIPFCLIKIMTTLISFCAHLPGASVDLNYDNNK